MAENPLAGTWQLKSFEQRDATGEVAYPLGRHPSGYLIYTPAGQVSVQMMAAEHTSAGDAAARRETFRAYCGAYDFTTEQVVHHVELSSLPQRVGADLVRFYSLDGDRLTLRTAPSVVNGVEQTGTLVWERTSPAHATIDPA